MKCFFTRVALVIFLGASLNSSRLCAQALMEKANFTTSANRAAPATPQGNAVMHTLHAKNGMNATPGNNYRWLTPQYKNVSKEAAAANAGYQHHPESGMLFTETPCDNCYELIGKRTESSKMFVKEGTGGRDIMQQTSSEPMHYKDAAGNWRTIKSKLEADNTHKGIYAAYEQPVPLSINTGAGNNYTSLGKPGKNIQFNKNLELVYVKAGSAEVLLGKANWTNYTAGDDGVYVKDAWPGIDIEMYAFRGGVKTNFIINHALPEYAGGQLLIRDHLQLDDGLTLSYDGKTKARTIFGAQEKYTGNLQIKDSKGADAYIISDATVFEKNNVSATFSQLPYYINGSILDIGVSGNYLDRPEASYPVIVDPLVQVATTLPIPPDGSTYSTTLAAMTGCLYTNPATTPANVTITDIQWANQYTARNGASLNDGYIEFYLGTCRSPGATTGLAGLWWYCNNAAAGTCTAAGGATYSIFADFTSCIPAPQCAPYNLNIQMYFYQRQANSGACNNMYIYLSQPLVITVFGRTVEITAAGVTATPPTICAGASSSLSVAGAYGVPPYTWGWVPGAMAGTPVAVTPTVTTTYTVTVTDACGVTASAGRVVNVNPLATITGITSMCQGNTTTLSNGGVAGTWSSVTPAVATVVAASGVVTGVTPGTSVIRFTTTAGACISSTTVTVTPVPGTISGTTTICAGSTTTLSNGATGGSWTSNNSTVATVTSGSGIVSGVTPGTAVITYSFGGSCYRTTTVTVNLLAPINGNLVICTGGTTPLSNIAVPGTWTSSNPSVATINLNTGLVNGVSPGTTTITFTTNTGCSTTAVVTVNGFYPITGTKGVCQGNTTALANAGIGGTWNSVTPAVAAISGTGVVTGVSPGTSEIQYTMPGNCVVTTTVTVYPLPAGITGTTTVCAGLTTLLNSATPGGTWSSSGGQATIGAGSGLVTGVSGGTVTITYTSAQGCITTIPLTVNPLPTAITGNTSICDGTTATLNSSPSGGTWSSDNTAVANIGLSSGILSAVSVGGTTVTYTLPTGCIRTTPVTVKALPGAPLTSDLEYCQYDSLLPALTATGSNLLWYTSASSTPDVGGAPTPSTAAYGTITWYVSQTVNGCEGPRAPLNVLVHIRVPRPFIAANKPFDCQYDTIGLYYSGPAVPGTANYLWSLPPHASLTGGQVTDGSIVVRFDTTLGHNYVTLMVGDGYEACNVIDTYAVTVYLASPAVGFGMNPTACVGDTVVVALSYIGLGITDYTWDFDGATITTKSYNHGGPYKLTWSDSGIHMVSLSVISNKDCPSRTVFDTIDVHPLPNVDIYPYKALNSRSSDICAGDSVQLDMPYDDPANNYVWAPDHFFKQNNSGHIIGRIENPGYVTVTVTTPFGCKTNGRIMIDAKSCCTVVFPNAFTPGGLSNRIFRPITAGNHVVHMFSIMNRWGQPVYQSNTERAGWDGTMNGVPMDVGVYYFYFKYDCDGKAMEEKGEVNLIR